MRSKLKSLGKIIYLSVILRHDPLVCIIIALIIVLIKAELLIEA